MLLFFVNVWASAAAMAAYDSVRSALFGVLFEAAASGIMKIRQNLFLSFKSISVFLACIT